MAQMRRIKKWDIGPLVTTSSPCSRKRKQLWPQSVAEIVVGVAERKRSFAEKWGGTWMGSILNATCTICLHAPPGREMWWYVPSLDGGWRCNDSD